MLDIYMYFLVVRIRLIRTAWRSEDIVSQICQAGSAECLENELFWIKCGAVVRRIVFIRTVVYHSLEIKKSLV